MIALPLKVFVLGGLGILAGWAIALAGRPTGQGEPPGLPARISSAFEDEEARRHLLGEGLRAARLAVRVIPPGLEGEAAARVRSALAVTGVHLALSLEFIPFTLLLLGAALALGLARRETLGVGCAFASPAVAFLGKNLAALAASWLVAFALSPAPLSPGSLWAAALALALGGFAYVGNLPLKL